jgi:hypothetical protein
MSSPTLRFEVRYPWGSAYCRKLQTALRKLGLVTGHDPLLEGGDSEGFLLAPTRQALQAAQQRMLRMEDADETDDVLDELRAMRVYEIMQDWKYLEWSVDVARLKPFGLQLRLVSRVMAKGGERMTFEVGKAPRRGRSTPRSKASQKPRRKR